MTRILTAVALALTLVTFGVTVVGATTLSSSVECGNTACTETWEFSCTASKVALALVRDISGADDLLMLTMIGTAPATFKGTGETQVAPPGLFSSGAVVGDFFTTKASTINGFAIVTNFSNTGAANYEIELFCVEKDGPIHDPKVFKRVQNQ